MLYKHENQRSVTRTHIFGKPSEVSVTQSWKSEAGQSSGLSGQQPNLILKPQATKSPCLQKQCERYQRHSHALTSHTISHTHPHSHASPQTYMHTLTCPTFTGTHMHSQAHSQSSRYVFYMFDLFTMRICLFC